MYNPPYYLSDIMSVVFHFLVYYGNRKDNPNGTLFLIISHFNLSLHMYFNLATLNAEINVYILKNIFLNVDTIFPVVMQFYKI